MVDFTDNILGDLLKRTKVLYDSIVWFSSFDTELKTKIIGWIQKDQLLKGIDEDGDIMGLYSKWTEIINPKKIAGTPYTLFDTGAFYKSMFIDVLTDFFVVDADPIKIDEEGKKTDLFKVYGDGIVGLTEESLDKLQIELKNKYIEYVRKILQID